MSLPLIRPARLSDLSTLFQFAQTAAYGITSLPRSYKLLANRLELSELAFSKKDPPFRSSDAYLFCLEYENEIIGISGIISSTETDYPFSAFHLVNEIYRYSPLDFKKKVPVLHFIQTIKKPTEIGSLFLLASFRQHGFGKLLSFGRFLFIAAFKKLFGSTVIAELRGVNLNGVSPFYSAVGEHFFQIDFPKADLLRCEHPEILEEFFPKHPIYVELLPKAAQQVIRVPHENTVPAQKILLQIGFKVSHYIDIFDAGPHLFAKTDEILPVKKSNLAVVQELRSELKGKQAILSNEKLNFRATSDTILIEEDRVILSIKAGSALQVKPGDQIRYFLC